MRRALACIAAATALAAAAVAGKQLDARARMGEGEQDLLYLPNGKYLKLLSLGHASLVADGVYIWAIQHYSDYTRASRGQYVEHVFGDVIAELDPRYVDPYWLGSLILIVENQDLDAGLRLLDKGFEANPGEWIFPYLAGWECARASDFARAVVYFDRAGKVPDAPPHVKRMKAGMFARSGDLRDAVAAWAEILGAPSSDDSSKDIARRQLRTLQVRLDVQTLNDAVQRFRQAAGRNPSSLAELRSEGLMNAIPVDVDGNPYDYDPRSGKVSSVTERVLGNP